MSTASAPRTEAVLAGHPAPARPEDRSSEVARLRLVPTERRRRRRVRLAPIVAVTLLVGSLLSVVIGHALLAEGQVHLSAASAALAAEQAAHRQELLDVAALETPGRITQVAARVLHMVDPGQVHQLPSVPLGKAEPAPSVAPAGAGTSATTPPSTTAPSTAQSSTAPAGTTSPASRR